MSKDPEALEGVILEDEIVTPNAHDVTPGWISRNRVALDRARAVTRVLMLVAPPPVRIPLALASLVADSALWAEDVRRRREDETTGRLRGVALALEGAAVVASSRFAPARLAANIGAIEAARRVTDRLLGGAAGGVR